MLLLTNPCQEEKHFKKGGRGGVEIFGFAASAIFLSVFVPKNFAFFGFGACCVLGFLFYFALGFRFSAEIKSDYRICSVFDAVWCFSGFSSENTCLNDLFRVHVFSDFACGFRL